MGEPDRESIRQGLDRTSSSSQRVAALIEAGFNRVFLGELCGVSEAAVTGWVKGRHKPRQEAQGKIDALRAAMAKLVLQNDLEPDQATSWMQSMPGDPPYVRPVDMIGTPKKAAELMTMIDDTSFRVQ